MERKKTLLWGTLAIAFSLFCSASLYQTVQRHTPIKMKIAGFPTLGLSSAPVQVVLIEDFQCKNCRAFSRKILPKLQRQYVKEGKVRFTLVPVSFLSGSQWIANALLEVYHQNPKQFFPYLKEILQYESDLTVAELIRLARRLNGIDMGQLERCINNQCHNEELQQNLAWAQGVMGHQFRTPALYVNGTVGSTFSFEAIQYQIDLYLRKQ
ncbi:MAG: thioredoxin domain-containing protein [Verrucomicrobia bacterium]|nr:thioredoxin domain-containing protein [Verrucomicrobiota bacterium]MBU6446052.1 thioredoxin domain-containing protein [Verrucomicrobiota bacterium]MDE3046953.1 thioredoxin domain-containing protein [Verrucomicrobiota bacterium]